MLVLGSGCKYRLSLAERFDCTETIINQLLADPSKPYQRDFPGGAVVENPPANAGDMGSISGPGRSHMPRSN